MSKTVYDKPAIHGGDRGSLENVILTIHTECKTEMLHKSTGYLYVSRMIISHFYKIRTLICARKCQIQMEPGKVLQGFRTFCWLCAWEVFLKLLGKLDKTCDSGKFDLTVQFFGLSQLVSNSLTT